MSALDVVATWLDQPHPRLARNTRRTVIAIDVFVFTPMVAWVVVHAIRVQSHPLTDTETYFFVLGLGVECMVGALFLYGLAHRVIGGHWRPTTYSRVEHLAVLLMMVACPLVVLVVNPSVTTPGPLGLVAVPAVALWLSMMRSLTQRARRALS